MHITTLHGHEAIAHAQATGQPLCSYRSQEEDAREDLTVEEALQMIERRDRLVVYLHPGLVKCYASGDHGTKGLVACPVCRQPITLLDHHATPAPTTGTIIPTHWVGWVAPSQDRHPCGCPRGAHAFVTCPTLTTTPDTMPDTWA